MKCWFHPTGRFSGPDNDRFDVFCFTQQDRFELESLLRFKSLKRWSDGESAGFFCTGTQVRNNGTRLYCLFELLETAVFAAPEVQEDEIEIYA